ncbi:Phosphopantothenate--cysteine ligase cab2 [Blastocladiella emersonii ATCC 22665]|nr:Phosphopantothenate--cysteine ligase cab2 [Blastocladiella emersonii ATCC 22665]
MDTPTSPSIAPASGTAYNVEHPDYFDAAPCPPGLSAAEAEINSFLAHQVSCGRPVALVTSGGTTVPLEKQTVRFLDNFSAGTRGATSAEYFLRAGYAVVFLHRQYSLRPFSRHYTHTRETLFDMLDVTPDGRVQIRPDLEARTRAVLEEYRAAIAGHALLSIEFTTIDDYLFLLRSCVTRIDAAIGARALYYLAAAVSDFYLPPEKMVVHKIQSRGGALALTLDPVPKLLRPLVCEWAPHGYVVSFKSKSRQALDRYGHQLVIGNMLRTRKHLVYFISVAADGTTTQMEPIQLMPEEVAAGVEIESHIVPDLVRRHGDWMSRTVPRSS